MPRKSKVLAQLEERRAVVAADAAKLNAELGYLDGVIALMKPAKAPVATPEAVQPVTTTEPASSAANPGADL